MSMIFDKAATNSMKEVFCIYTYRIVGAFYWEMVLKTIKYQ